ncbi:hypothetical protein GDO86_012901 [Hymenochirus boettgeri]|nr:hypothetical protein GDO86_012901 [Hymenochirus boettgeri]
MNGFDEEVEFLPATNSKKVEKRGPKKKFVLLGVVIGAALLSLTVGLLVWHFAYRNARVQRVYTGFLRIANTEFRDAYENSTTAEFNELSERVTNTLKNVYLADKDIAPYIQQCSVHAFSEGIDNSVMGYYWSEFSVPAYREVAMDKAISELKLPSVNPRQRSSAVVSLVAYPADPQIARNFRDKSCAFFLHSQTGSVTKFSSPGFPDSAYPPNVRCQWTLRADAGHMIHLNFKTFRMEKCKVNGGDYVTLYDSLSPLEPRILNRLCGSYPPSYNLTFFSSENVMLVTLVTDYVGKFPGFHAEFKQLPKITLCGGNIKDSNGNITSPYFPAHYPPNRDCIWQIEVPNNKHVKLRFNLFYVADPGAPANQCTKDYVEVKAKKYCGEQKSFVVSSDSNKISVRFVSDQSYTDTGFTAEYLSFEPQNPCPNQFSCMTGRCISLDKKCDGWNDCDDFSDELACTCTDQQFRCASSNHCKPKYFVCDGVNDCGDNSDELQCKCPENMFKCGNGKCIPNAKKCDQTDDCGDGYDEAKCDKVAVTACTQYTYKCKNNQCISKKNPECDGEQDCSDGSDEDTSKCSCGKRPYTKKSRIVGGINADIGEFPWQVSLHTKNDKHTCGASLVSSKFLISAAHCFQDDRSIRYSDPALWTAYLGLHDQAQIKGSNVMERKIKNIRAHTGFNDNTYDNDIAVLELESPVSFTDFIQPICIPDTSYDFPVGKSLWVTGWGALTEGGTGAQILQKAEIRVINQTECNKLLDDQLSLRMLCAGFISGGIDACQGDSGGPLSSVESNSKIYLAGIVSWGEGCARRNKPGVYTRVTAMRDWIKEKTGL